MCLASPAHTTRRLQIERTFVVARLSLYGSTQVCSPANLRPTRLSSPQRRRPSRRGRHRQPRQRTWHRGGAAWLAGSLFATRPVSTNSDQWGKGVESQSATEEPLVHGAESASPCILLLNSPSFSSRTAGVRGFEYVRKADNAYAIFDTHAVQQASTYC